MSEKSPTHNFYKNGQELRSNLPPITVLPPENTQAAVADLSQEILYRLPH